MKIEEIFQDSQYVYRAGNVSVLLLKGIVQQKVRQVESDVN
jgi:hypothetical protein